MIGIDLFSGAGGLSLGASLAGIDVQLAIESDPHSVATYSHNHKTTTVISSDIRTVKEINVVSDSTPKILFGGPPCQGFSTSNQKNRNKDNPLNWLFKEFFRISDIWKPEWLLLENVTGIVTTEKGYFLRKIIKEFQRRGYKVVWQILSALEFSIPQKRSRFFIIGSRNGEELIFPESLTFIPYTVNSAIHDLPVLENGASKNVLPYKCKPKSDYVRLMRGNLKKCPNHLVTRNAKFILERYKYIQQGENWQSIPTNLISNYKNISRCHTGIYYRLKESEPSVVIGNFRKNMLIHPLEDRGLSVREAARLQSFPDWYEFQGSIGFQQQQVGNAVPPLLAKAVFQKILSVA